MTTFLKKNAVFIISFFVALFSAFLVPPDEQYAGYFDYRTLTCLFCTLAVVCALRDIRFFSILARRIVELTGNARSAVLILVYITFLGSMLLANDMALLTFLPLGFFVLSSTKKEKYMAFTFVMQNIAANLGGMLTPFGNPQNLYLYQHFHIADAEFFSIMLYPFLLSVALITLLCFFCVKPEPLTLEKEESSLPLGLTIFYLLLFAFSILIVFRIIPYQSGLIVVPLCLFLTDKKALKDVDYGLLGTFVCFFIFSGNVSRLDSVRDFFMTLMKDNTLLVSVFSCQFISNVPSAILLSQFTQNYKELLLGVNIGGVGTLISSLASLITFREYTSRYPEKTWSYIRLFSVLNFGFLIVLTAFCLFL